MQYTATLQNFAMFCNTATHCDTVIQCNTIACVHRHCNIATLQHSATLSNTLQHLNMLRYYQNTAIQLPACIDTTILQHSATNEDDAILPKHCNTIACAPRHERIPYIHAMLQHTATLRNTLKYTATHCNTQQHTATHCSTLQHTNDFSSCMCL